MTIISCIASLIMNYFLIEIYGVGGAVLGYLGYVVLMTLGYYIYYIPNVLQYSSLILLRKSVGPSFLVGVISCIVITALEGFGILIFSNVWILLIVKGSLFVLVYFGVMALLVYPLSKIKDKLQSIKG